MEWGKLLGEVLGGVAHVAMLTKWMQIDDDSDLRYTIRGDIRNMSVEDTKTVLGGLKNSINNFAYGGEDRMRNKATKIREILIEEANARDDRRRGGR